MRKTGRASAARGPVFRSKNERRGPDAGLWGGETGAHGSGFDRRGPKEEENKVEAVKAFIESSPLMCFFVIAFIYMIGDMVGTMSKAWVPSVFVVAVLFLIGYWTILPKEVIGTSGLNSTFIGVLCPYILVVHMGTTISVKQLAKQWKTIVCCLAGLVGMCALCMLLPVIGVVDRSLVVSGLPPLTGGIVATKIMTEAATNAGLPAAALFATVMMVVQGFAGYPITAICLKKEGRRLLKDYRSGNVKVTAAAGAVDEANGKMASTEPEKKKLIPSVPEKYASTAFSLAKLALLAVAAFYVGQIKYGTFTISGMVWALIFGIVATELGFLEKDLLHKCGCFNFICFALMMLVFDGLKNAQPADIVAMIVPMIVVIVVGVLGMGIVSFLISKVLKVGPAMAFATALTTLYGFPPNLILTTEACKALAESPEENDYLMANMLPQMIVGGFTTVTISSVLIAGVFANWL